MSDVIHDKIKIVSLNFGINSGVAKYVQGHSSLLYMQRRQIQCLNLSGHFQL